jgi:single-strand DNA-binding protein
MNNLNSVIIEGNLVRDPETKTVASGQMLCMFSIANNRYYKQGQETEKEVSFFDVDVWGKAAEVCARLGHKGRGVRVVGRLKQETWTDNSGKHQKVKIIAEHVEWRPESNLTENAKNTYAESNSRDTDDIPF